MKRYIILFVVLIFNIESMGQAVPYVRGDDGPDLDRILMDRGIQISTTYAFNLMYNFKFDEAAREFKWLTVEFPDHPIGDFLFGLNEWWRIVPDTKQTRYDAECHRYMDRAIRKAERMLRKDKGNKEARFFISAAYAVKGRLFAERERWIKSANAGRKAIKFLDESRGEENINPELLFGDGVYNFYSKWIHENYKSLRPLLTFFRKGDKEAGIRQLEHVSNNAFYTRMEARYFLVQIYAMEDDNMKSYQLSDQMHKLYPDNSFFHRFVARNAFALGRFAAAERLAKELLDNINKGKYGYGPTDGRYGSYILGYIHEYKYKDLAKAKEYYFNSINYSLENNSRETGYFASANLALGRIALDEGRKNVARNYLTNAINNSDRKSNTYKEANKLLRSI